MKCRNYATEALLAIHNGCANVTMNTSLIIIDGERTLGDWLTSMYGRMRYNTAYKCLNYLNFKGFSIDGINLTLANLNGCVFENIQISNAYFNNVTMKNVKFINCEINCVSFRGAYFENVIFIN